MSRFTVREYRRMREISQTEMAEMLGIHVNTYIAWEKDPKKIPVDKAMNICNIFGVDIDSIIFCS